MKKREYKERLEFRRDLIAGLIDIHADMKCQIAKKDALLQRVATVLADPTLGQLCDLQDELAKALEVTG